VMQHEERMAGDVTRAQAEETARKLLEQLAKIDDTARVEALGNVDVTAGVAIYVVESMTRIIGGFYVITDVHTWDKSGVHRMQLTISADEELPRLDYDEPAVIKAKTAAKAGTDYSAILARLDE